MVLIKTPAALQKMGNFATNKFLTAILLSHILLQRELEFMNKLRAVTCGANPKLSLLNAGK